MRQQQHLAPFLPAIIIMVGLAGEALGQTSAPFNPGIQLQDNASRRITLRSPSGGISSNYTLEFPATGPGTGALLFTTNGTGATGWLGAGADGSILSLSGGLPAWVDPVTLVQGSFVRYNVASAQTTAGSGSRLFDVAYSGLGSGVAALGARIAAESGANANAGGLSIRATANGTGTSTGLSVEASGGATNYAGLFTSGKVGIGTATPISHVEVVAPAATSTTQAIFSTWTPFMAMKVGQSISPSAATASGFQATMAYDSTVVGGSADLSTGIFSSRFSRIVATNNSSIGELRGLQGNAVHQGTGTLATANALLAAPVLLSAGTITNAVGLNSSVTSSSTGTIVNGKGVLSQPVFQSSGGITNFTGIQAGAVVNGVGATGVVTNYTGVLVDNIDAATVGGTRRAFFYNGAGANAPFVIEGDGDVGVGTSTPSRRFHVTGTAGLTNARLGSLSAASAEAPAVQEGLVVADNNGDIRRRSSSGIVAPGVLFTRTTNTLDFTGNTNLLTVLLLSLEANNIYEIEAIVAYDADNGGAPPTSHLQVAVNAPAGATIRWNIVNGGGSGAFSPSSITTNGTAIGMIRGSSVDQTHDLHVFIKGVVVMGGTGGDIEIQAAQADAAGNINILPNSYLKATRVQ